MSLSIALGSKRICTTFTKPFIDAIRGFENSINLLLGDPKGLNIFA
jgi:hypothetical protein